MSGDPMLRLDGLRKSYKGVRALRGLDLTVNDNEIFALLKAATGYQREAGYGPAKPGETFRIFLDIRRAHDVLGWTPEVPLEEGITQTVASLA